jgi:NAD(P)-dependent dehydrogenase (short-subunit alcohol dehydrogenase family)
VAQALGPPAIAVPADLSGKAAVDAMFDQVLAHFGGSTC